MVLISNRTANHKIFDEDAAINSIGGGWAYNRAVTIHSCHDPIRFS